MRINNRLFCSEKLGSKCTSVFLRLGIFAKVIFFACKKDTFLNVKHSPRRPLYTLTVWTQDISRNLINCKHHFRVLEQRFTIWTTYRPLKTSSDGTVTWYSFGLKMKLNCNPGSLYQGKLRYANRKSVLNNRQTTFLNSYPFSVSPLSVTPYTLQPWCGCSGHSRLHWSFISSPHDCCVAPLSLAVCRCQEVGKGWSFPAGLVVCGLEATRRILLTSNRLCCYGFGYGCMRRTLTTMQLHTQDYDHMIVSHAKASAEAQKGLGHTLTQSAVLPSRDFNSCFFWR